MIARRSKSRRHALYGQIHLAAKRMGFSDAEYRAMLEREFGVRSAKDLSDTQLEALARAFRREGAADRGGRGASHGHDRPSAAQWDKLAALSRVRGWSGLEDAALATFVKRVAKADAPRFLSRRQMADVLIGLERWIEHDRNRGRV